MRAGLMGSAEWWALASWDLVGAEVQASWWPTILRAPLARPTLQLPGEEGLRQIGGPQRRLPPLQKGGVKAAALLNRALRGHRRRPAAAEGGADEGRAAVAVDDDREEVRPGQPEAAAEPPEAEADGAILGPITIVHATTPTVRCYLQGRLPKGGRTFIVGVTARQYPDTYKDVAAKLQSLILQRGLSKAQAVAMVRERHPDLLR